jgi:diguanylate cyclase (GGDEF)-like protein
MDLILFFDKKPKFIVISLGIILAIAIATLDYAVTSDVYLFVFYLLPILFVTRFAGRSYGIFLSIFSAFNWGIIDFQQKNLNSYLIAIWNTLVVLSFFLIVIYLADELYKALEREKTLARIDYKTGLANKALFFELAQLEINRANRYRHPLTIAYIDIDDFKVFNDKFTRKSGNLLLKEVAQSLKNNLRQTDIIARLGGDEFAILLPGSGFEPSKIVLQRVHSHLLESMDNLSWPVTFSIGAVTLINPPESVNEMLEKADRLMYFVKTHGKDGLEHRTGI